MRSVTASVPSCLPKRLWAQLCNAQLRNLGARGAVREHRGGVRATSRTHAAEERVLEQTATASVVVNRSVRERMLYGRGTRTGPGRGPAARMAAVLCAAMACSMVLPLVEPGTTLGESSTTEVGAIEALTKSSTTLDWSSAMGASATEALVKHSTMLGESSAMGASATEALTKSNTTLDWSSATEASATEALTKSSTMLGESSTTEAGATEALTKSSTTLDWSSAMEAGAMMALIGCWVLRDEGDGARELRSHAAAAASGGGDGEAAPPARHDAGRAHYDGGERHDGADPSPRSDLRRCGRRSLTMGACVKDGRRGGAPDIEHDTRFADPSPPLRSGGRYRSSIIESYTMGANAVMALIVAFWLFGVRRAVQIVDRSPLALRRRQPLALVKIARQGCTEGTGPAPPWWTRLVRLWQ